jgi:hypothetical protein
MYKTSGFSSLCGKTEGRKKKVPREEAVLVRASASENNYTVFVGSPYEKSIRIEALKYILPIDVLVIQHHFHYRRLSFYVRGA